MHRCFVVLSALAAASTLVAPSSLAQQVPPPAGVSSVDVTLPLRFLQPSEAVDQLSVERSFATMFSSRRGVVTLTPQFGPPRGISDLVPDHARSALRVRGTAEAVARVKNQVAQLDAAPPRYVPLSLRFLRRTVAGDGTQTETVLAETTVTAVSGRVSRVRVRNTRDAEEFFDAELRPRWDEEGALGTLDGKLLVASPQGVSSITTGTQRISGGVASRALVLFHRKPRDLKDWKADLPATPRRMPPPGTAYTTTCLEVTPMTKGVSLSELVAQQLRLRFVSPSGLIAQVQKDRLLPPGISDIVPDANTNALNVRGTAGALAALRQEVARLDVAPRQVLVALRLVRVSVAADGTPTETTLQAPTLATLNQRPGGIAVNGGTDGKEFVLGVLPRLDENGVIALRASLRLDGLIGHQTLAVQGGTTVRALGITAERDERVRRAIAQGKLSDVRGLAYTAYFLDVTPRAQP